MNATPGVFRSANRSVATGRISFKVDRLGCTKDIWSTPMRGPAMRGRQQRKQAQNIVHIAANDQDAEASILLPGNAKYLGHRLAGLKQRCHRTVCWFCFQAAGGCEDEVAEEPSSCWGDHCFGFLIKRSTASMLTTRWRVIHGRKEKNTRSKNGGK